MSISNALNGAVSGLTASSLAAEVISSNLANALTPGYGTRRLEQTGLSQGLPGVEILGITRNVDPGILSDRRQSDSAVAFTSVQAEFLAGIDRLVGTPDEPFSLQARLSAFEAALISASSSPNNPASLQSAILRAGELTDGLNNASSELQRRRTEADQAIGVAVNSVNSLLENIRDVNIQISNHGGRDGYAASLLDQRQALIDQLSEFVRVRQVNRDKGTVALFTPGGAILLDGNAAKLEFSVSNVVAPHMTIDNGLLSGLTINGIAVTTSGDRSPIEGGRLAALFTVRDELAPDVQTQLDAVARDLIERFQDPGIDPTRPTGGPGLLTDGGNAFLVANEIGLAGRLSVNAAVDSSQGGEFWRLRDGLGAVTPGTTGNGSLIAQLAGAMSSVRSLASGDLGSTARSASDHFATMSSRMAQNRLTTDQALSFAAARQSELTELELSNGVDSDAELQRLLLVEQAYAANARMIQTVDEMMQTLLRI